MHMRPNYKPILTLLLLFVAGISGIVQAQNIPSTTARSNASPVPTPANYQNGRINMIRTWEPQCSITDPGFVKSVTRSTAEVRCNTEYFDGLGRSIQKVSRQISPSAKDLVHITHYDSLGREQYSYLPYTPKTGVYDGTFKQDAFAAQKAFYQDINLNPGAAGENVYYGQTEYEQSVLNNFKREFSPGDSWAKFGGNHPKVYGRGVNGVADSVRMWNMGSGITPSSSQFYPARSLNKSITTDPNGRQVIEYRDKDDLLILRKVQESTAPGSAHMGWACTYYVHDLMNNLRFVIQPKGVELIRSNWTLTSNVINELCFIYRYDSRQRKIIEKMPGADSIEYVYNKHDKIAMWRDGNLKQGQRWKVFRYDGQGREILKALFTYPFTRQQWEDHFAANVYSDTSAIPLGSDNNLFPLVETFYDDYNFTGKANYDATDIAKVSAGSNPYSEVLPSTPSLQTRGLMTGKRVRVEQTDTWLVTTVYYDRKARAIQTTKDNIAGGKTTINRLFDFSGKELSSYVKQINPRSTHTPMITQLVMTHYDAAGRVDSIKQRIMDNGPMVTLAVMVYDELGRLKQKRLGVTGPSTQMETLNYEYNLQNWLTAVNKSYINTPGSNSNWFGEQLSFDSGFTKLQYNGNIAGVHWKSRADGIARLYGYEYNTLQHLIRADFLQQNNGSTNWTNDQVDFTVRDLSYDINGNLLSMKQVGMDGKSIKTLDSLKYGLISGSNKLSFVTDKKNNPQTILGDFKEIVNNESPDYTYNTAGFLSKDRNKGIDSIYYNHNNIPVIVANNGRGRIDYQTDGEGRILSKIVNDTTIAGNTTVWTYIEGFTYVSRQTNPDTLEYIVHAEGRTIPVIKTGQALIFKDEYFLRDHLNSIRTVLTTRSDTASYAASMESSRSALENALFSNIDLTRAPKPSGYPSDPTTNPNDYVIMLNAQSGQKIGPGKALYVAAGDTIQAGIKAFYKSTSASTAYATPTQMLAAIVQSFITTGPSNGVHNATGPTAPITTSFSNSDYTAIQNSDPDQNLSDKPRAYLNVIAYDERFNLVPENSFVIQVQGSPDALQNLATSRFTIKKSGFLYIFMSNESAQNVYFDNLVIVHTSGPLVQNTHYYPYGLTMAGISSQSFTPTGYERNRMMFNGKELHRNEYRDGGSLDWYDFGTRMYDPQIGRWMIVDPKANEMRRYSPYSFAFNNPIRFTDPDGMKPWTDYFNLKGQYVGTVKDNKNEAALLLTVSDDAAVVKATIASGYYINNPGQDLINNLRESYAGMDQDLKERYFAMGEKGKVSNIVVGGFTDVEWKTIIPARENLRAKGDWFRIDAHGHPLTKDANGAVTGYGLPSPSSRATTPDGKDGDLEDAQRNDDSRPKIIMGYKEEKERIDKTKMESPMKLVYKPQLGFYNQGGKSGEISLEDMIKAIFEINKFREKLEKDRQKREKLIDVHLDNQPANQ